LCMLEIEILFKEYDSLRTEIIERIKLAYGFFVLVGGVFAFWTGFSTKGWIQVLFLVISELVLCVSWFFNQRAIRRCAIRLEELEDEINDLARAPALCWETRMPRGLKGLESLGDLEAQGDERDTWVKKIATAGGRQKKAPVMREKLNISALFARMFRLRATQDTEAQPALRPPALHIAAPPPACDSGGSDQTEVH
jgi:hypothetical protein